eukprot:3214859-Pleurochrysis_carterae.AAC.3
MTTVDDEVDLVKDHVCAACINPADPKVMYALRFYNNDTTPPSMHDSRMLLCSLVCRAMPRMRCAMSL